MLNPFHSGHRKTGILTNNDVYPDEMLHIVAFHQGMRVC